ncbi:MAG: biotin/lipoyl-binding carrier protein [Microbacterium sp.]|uniref:biotin/lipoyl-binding carrier protein n=1 Tax=Microbacterium sp. TaxID=51671 RepID=UPI0039E608EF
MTEVNADLSANVWKIVVSEGDVVAADDTLMILESMKMEIPVEAPVAGTVVSLAVAEGDTIDEGALLATIE